MTTYSSILALSVDSYFSQNGQISSGVSADLSVLNALRDLFPGMLPFKDLGGFETGEGLLKDAGGLGVVLFVFFGVLLRGVGKLATDGALLGLPFPRPLPEP